ncbi:uncharacterized protein LOC131005315 [Salvia miltiorrhiza]|uniref:uncharacterized protein LOC131005315 n=3 Tax=Salvia miltiorrhiza TaxID=226208 RepID=UPI0025ACB1ED|nr:uncharacterized protein LOC131005315 [Salvia miltiorrhiza]
MNEYGRYFVVNYGGAFNGYEYIGGSSKNLHIFGDTMASTVYMINYLMMENSLSTNYSLYYLTKRLNGRVYSKNILADDNDLLQLLASQPHFPEIYVVEDDYSGGVYVPSFDLPQSFGYGGESSATFEGGDGLEAIQRYAYLDLSAGDSPAQQSVEPSVTWGNDQSTGWPSWDEPNPYQYDRLITDRCWGPADDQYTYEPQFVEDAGNVDEDYVPSSEAETDTSASEDLSEPENVRRAGIEYAGWQNLQIDEDDDEQVPGADELTNWLVPVIPLDAAATVVDIEDYQLLPRELSKNMYFNSKDDLIVAIGLWNMKQGKEFSVSKSDSRRVYVKCKHSDTCPFKLHASSQDGVIWGVYKFTNEHSCDGELGRVARIKAPAKVVAAYLAQKIHDDCEILKPKAIQLELRREFGVQIKYDVALRARNRATEMVYGRHDQSFEMLPKYLYMLRQSNPGSRVEWEVDDDGRFKHLFVALAASATPFMFSLRPVIVVDGTHLKGKNRGILFVAVTKDGNESLFPLAYGVGPKENDESWSYFMSRIRRVYGQADPLLIVSDQHISIANAIRNELPNATHGLCYYHLQNNLKHYGKAVVEVYRQAAFAYEKSDFNRAMNALKVMKRAAYDKLMGIGPEKWARSMCSMPVRRYSFMTSNAAEAFNSRLLWARRLPICSMLEAIRIVIEKWFSERLRAAQQIEQGLTVEAGKRVAIEVQKSRRYTAQRLSGMKYKVQTADRSFKVDLEKKKCECRVFQLDQLPCSHSIAAISEAGDTIAEYVDSYYTNDFLIDTYSREVNNLPPRRQWLVPEHIAEQVVLPLIVKGQAGRPKEGRHRGGGEGTSTQADESSSIRRRKPKKCSICHEEGHSKRTCAGRATEPRE